MASGATPSPLKLRDIAERLQCRLEGGASDGNVEIHRVAGIEHAGPGDLTFVANPRYHALIGQTRASAVILAPSQPGETSAPRSCAVLRAENPYLAFAHAVALLVQTTPPAKGVDRLSSVAADATLGPDVSIDRSEHIVSGDRRCVYRVTPARRSPISRENGRRLDR